MPLILRYKSYRFFFYSNEGHPREPVHIHIRDAAGEAKVWLSPDVAVARSSGYDARTLRELAGVVAVNRALIERSWHEYFA